MKPGSAIVFVVAAFGLLMVAALVYPAPVSAEKRCLSGMERSEDTYGQCCWPGQVWTGGACVGRPSRCPSGFKLAAAGCEEQFLECPSGQVVMSDQAHCCWPGQSWSGGACAGDPTCPPKYVAVGTSCEPIPTCRGGRSSPWTALTAAGRVWRTCSSQGSRDGHLVNCVTWDDARTNCAGQGGRLPTEAEWEKAARGCPGDRWSCLPVGEQGRDLRPWGDGGRQRRLRDGYDGASGEQRVGCVAVRGTGPRGERVGVRADWYGKDAYSSTRGSCAPAIATSPRPPATETSASAAPGE